MSRYGGPGCWFYVPLFFSSIPIEKKTLLTLELREMQLYPKHLNKEQLWRRKRVKTGRSIVPMHAARAPLLARANWKNKGISPVRLQLMYVHIHNEVVATDHLVAFSTARTVSVHSSLLSITELVPSMLLQCDFSGNLR